MARLDHDVISEFISDAGVTVLRNQDAVKVSQYLKKKFFGNSEMKYDLGVEITKMGLTKAYFTTTVSPDELFAKEAEFLIECHVKDRRTAIGRHLMDHSRDWGFVIRHIFILAN